MIFYIRICYKKASLQNINNPCLKKEYAPSKKINYFVPCI